VPMVGGMISSTILTLIVIPAIYSIAKGWRLMPEVPSPAPGRRAVPSPAE